MTAPTKRGTEFSALTRNDARVLRHLAKNADEFEGGTFFPFKPLQKALRMTRRDVRLSCRRLTRKGLARFSNNLVNYDFKFVGAGYAATELGCACVQGTKRGTEE